LDVVRTGAQGAAALELRGVAKGIGNTVECLRDLNTAGCVDDPSPFDLTIEPHFGQEADDGLLILGFGLLDDAARHQLVEHLPHGLRMVSLKDFDAPRIRATSSLLRRPLVEHRRFLRFGFSTISKRSIEC
jgi:hypothetical protein